MRIVLILLLALAFYLDVELILLHSHVGLVALVTGGCLLLLRAIAKSAP